jgi:hypothetical protein
MYVVLVDTRLTTGLLSHQDKRGMPTQSRAGHERKNMRTITAEEEKNPRQTQVVSKRSATRHMNKETQPPTQPM